jgi:hypothetical protein
METTTKEQIDNIKARADAEIAKTLKEAELRTHLPLKPQSISVYPIYGTEGSVHYEAKTFQEALDMLKHFKTLPGFEHSQGGVSIRHYSPEGMTTAEPIEILMQIDTLPTFKFFTEINGQIWCIRIGFPLHLIGRYIKDKPYARTNFRYSFGAKFPLNCIASFAPAEYYGEGSKRMEYYSVTAEQIAGWANGQAT